MRRAANEKPVVQMVLIGILVVLFAVVLYTRILSSDSGAEPTSATESSTAAPPATGAPAAPAPAEGTVAPDATAPSAPVAPSGPDQATVPPSALVPGPGLPEAVVKAYADGKAIVLLIVRACGSGPVGAGGSSGPCVGRWREAGTDDKSVKAAVKLLRSSPDLAVFVTGAKNIARYSRITNGVAVSRVPALIVIRPKRVSGDVPEASVSYGFRGPESVLQAVNDAIYDGHDVPYYPE